MCYLCGPDKAVRSINAALRVWGRKSSSEPHHVDGRPWLPSWGDSHAWTRPPTKAKKWTARDFDAYQKRTRYASRATRLSFVDNGGNQNRTWGDTHNWSPYV